jgi:hypothetical protein
LRRVLPLVVVAIGAAGDAGAWNPSLLSGGAPVRWETGLPVEWNPDGGPLGKLGNAAAILMAADALGTWEAIPAAVVGFSQGGPIVDPGTGLPVDVTSAEYAAVVGAANGQNPVIFDNDREIFSALGIPAGVVGFGGILRTSGGRITKGLLVLQGDWFDDEPAGAPPEDPGEVDEARFRGMMVHEAGHFLNLAHVSVNHELAATGLPGCPPPSPSHIETMSPFLAADTLTPHHDDATGLSELYPSGAFLAGTASLRGRLIDRDGATPFDGANIVLRPATGDCGDLYALAQAAQSGASPAESGGAGSYDFSGLAPGGAYTVLATTIQDGAGYPIPPPASLGGPDDFHNGASEDWFDPPDDPGVAVAVAVGAGGTTVGGVDIGINNSGGPGEVPGDAASGLRIVPAGGAPQPVDLALDDGEVDTAIGFGGTAQAAWVNRFTPAPAQLPLSVERVDILFWHGSVAPGRGVRLLVYVDPNGTGDPAAATLVHAEDVAVQSLSTVAFNQFVLSAPVLVEGGDVYAGAFDLVADPDATFIVSADVDTAAGRSYLQAGGTEPPGYALQGGLTWMIRLHGTAGLPAGSVRLSWGEACNAVEVPGQDYAVYEGSLGPPGAGLDHAPIACGTGRATSLVVVPGAGSRYWLVAPLLAGREGSAGAGTGGSSREPAAPCGAILPDACP